MTSTVQVEQLLRRYAGGERKLGSRLLACMADALLFVPVRSAEASDQSDEERMHIPTVDRAGRPCIPVFTSEEFMQGWADDYLCVALSGADIAQTCPDDIWMLVNQGHLMEVELTPSDVSRIAQIPSEHGLTSDETAAKRPRRHTARDKRMVSGEVVIEKLGELLKDYPEVEEAFFELIGGTYSYAILGVLRNEMDCERRFVMMSEIAEISRELFGIAGGIEVYDDLHMQHSHSWQLFQALTPFYVRKQQSDEHSEPLRAQIERVETIEQRRSSEQSVNIKDESSLQVTPRVLEPKESPLV